MAKVIGPLHSDSASGQFAKTIVFGVWKGIKYARSYVLPENPNTSAQQVIRDYFATSVDAWQTANQTIKDDWNEYVATNGLAMSGFNFFLGKYVEFLIDNAGTPPTVINAPPNMS